MNKRYIKLYQDYFLSNIMLILLIRVTDN